MATCYSACYWPITLVDIRLSQQHTELQPQPTSSTKAKTSGLFCYLHTASSCYFPSRGQTFSFSPHPPTTTLHYFFRIKDKVSHLHKTTCKIINSLLHLQAADRNSYKPSCFHHGVNENRTLLGSYTACSGTTRCIIAQKSTDLKIILP
jgi:hypothetical protein